MILLKKNKVQNHELYIRRCFELARLGAGSVSPNPLVGAVLVHEGRIIGEGWHAKYGAAHAEVNTMRSIRPQDRALVSESTLYVSLEPCCIFGRTPPCTNLILENKIPRVVISCLDQTPGVAGHGVEILRKAGVSVTTGILEEEGKALSQIRNTFVTAERPYIILKWAQSADGFLGKEGEQLWLTQSLTKRWVHKWRSEAAAILVGTNTACIDDPALTNRHYYGHSPLRIVLDRHSRLPQTHQLLDGSTPTWVISEQSAPSKSIAGLEWIQLDFDGNLLSQLMQRLVVAKKSSLIVEGGQQLLQSFINNDLWDEARVLVAPQSIGKGIAAPRLNASHKQMRKMGADKMMWWYRY